MPFTNGRLRNKSCIKVCNRQNLSLTDRLTIYPVTAPKPDLLIRLFNELIEHHPEYKEYLPEVNEEVIRKVIADLHMRVRTNEIISLIMGRYALIG